MPEAHNGLSRNGIDFVRNLRCAQSFESGADCNLSAIGFNNLPAHRGIWGIVSPLHQDLRFDSGDQIYRSVFVKNHNHINKGVKRKHVGSLILFNVWACGAFKSLDRCIGVDPQHQEISLIASELQEIGVTIVQNVKTSVGKYDPSSCVSHFLNAFLCRLEIHDLFRKQIMFVLHFS